MSDGARSAVTVTSNDDVVPPISCFGLWSPQAKSAEKDMHCVETLLMQLRALLGDGYVMVCTWALSCLLSYLILCVLNSWST